jgi:hypothetical protein
MAGSESVAKTAISSAKAAVVVSGEVGRSAVYRRYRRGRRTLGKCILLNLYDILIRVHFTLQIRAKYLLVNVSGIPSHMQN